MENWKYSFPVTTFQHIRFYLVNHSIRKWMNFVDLRDGLIDVDNVFRRTSKLLDLGKVRGKRFNRWSHYITNTYPNSQ